MGETSLKEYLNSALPHQLLYTTYKEMHFLFYFFDISTILFASSDIEIEDGLCNIICLEMETSNTYFPLNK